MADSSVEIFNERISDILNTIQIEKKIFYLIGDLNIDFLKSDAHISTNSLIDVLYSNNVFPLITKPTRVTNKSATLIDHILTNNFYVNARHFQGILCNSISDHYAVFHIACNTMMNDSLNDTALIKRNMNHRNIMKFVNEMKTQNWQCVLNEIDPQTAYSRFHEIISSKYNSCFPYRKIAKKNYRNKPWLSVALKESIKRKNQLYAHVKKYGHPALECHYKKYRNKLNQLIKIAERKYYHERKKLCKSSLINLYFSFAYPYLIYCNHVWGNNYTTSLEKLLLVQKKIIRIITCSPFRAHTEPLIVANRILNVYDISSYISGMLMYECMCDNVPSSLHDFFQTNSDVHSHATRYANDIHVPHGRLDVRRFSFKISGANLWNSLPEFLKRSNNIHLFKRNLRNYLIDVKRTT